MMHTASSTYEDLKDIKKTLKTNKSYQINEDNEKLEHNQIMRFSF